MCTIGTYVSELLVQGRLVPQCLLQHALQVRQGRAALSLSLQLPDELRLLAVPCACFVQSPQQLRDLVLRQSTSGHAHAQNVHVLSRASHASDRRIPLPRPCVCVCACVPCVARMFWVRALALTQNPYP